MTRGTWVAAPSRIVVRYRTVTVSGPGFHRGSRDDAVSYWVTALPSRITVRYRTITVSGPAFQRGSRDNEVSYSVPALPYPLTAPTTPCLQRRQA